MKQAILKPLLFVLNKELEQAAEYQNAGDCTMYETEGQYAAYMDGLTFAIGILENTLAEKEGHKMVLITSDGEILDYEKELAKFFASVKDDDLTTFSDYICECGYTQVEEITPTEYLTRIPRITEKFDDTISSVTFDEIVADKYNLWNYALDDISETSEVDSVVLIKFSDCYRLCEMPVVL